MNEADVVTGRAFANSTRCKAHAFCGEPLDCECQVVDPKPDVIKSGDVHLWATFWVDGLHEIDLNFAKTCTCDQNVFVDVLFLTSIFAGFLKAEHVAPKSAEFTLIGAANGNLLNTKNLKRAAIHGPE